MATKKTQVTEEIVTETTPNRVKENYVKNVVPALMKTFNYKNQRNISLPI